MNFRLIFPAGAALVLAVSCTPYVEAPPEAPVDPAQNKTTTSDPQKPRDQRETVKKENEGERTPEKKPTNEGSTVGRTEPTEKKPTTTGSATGDAPKPTPPRTIPVARPVPGKPGQVFSPYNNKIINVEGFPSGTLVADPTFPPSEKMHFRVP